MDVGLLALLAVGGYFLYQKFFVSTKSQATAANNAAIQQSTATANQATQQQVAASGQQPSLNPSTINGLVNTIVTAMNSSGDYPLDIMDNNARQIVDSVDTILNTADWVALTSQFGTKQLATGQSVDLLTALSIVLPEAFKGNLNSYLIAQNIGAPNYIMIP